VSTSGLNFLIELSVLAGNFADGGVDSLCEIDGLGFIQSLWKS